MPAVAVAGIAGMVGSVYAANKQSKAAKSASQAQTQATGDANKLQLQMFNQARADNEPFRQNALSANNQIMALLGMGGQTQAAPQSSGFNPSGGTFFNGSTYAPLAAPQQPVPSGQFRAMNPKLMGLGSPPSGFNPSSPTFPGAPTGQPTQQAAPTTPTQTPQQARQAAFDLWRSTPGYQFGLDTGRLQLESSAAARSGLYSGATFKALQKFGNDYADQQGYTPYMNRLASLAGMGQTVNSQNAQMGMNYANQAGQNLISAGTARASGIQNSANAWGNAAGNIAGIGGWLAGQYSQPTNTGLNNYNWASGSGFGNNWGNF